MAAEREKFITTTRKEFWRMFRSAMGGGVIISFIGICKNLLAKMSLAPFWQGFLYSTNYSLGFILIQDTGSTLATKQPAYTANHVAGSFDVNKENGSIIIYPDTHKLGILPFKSAGGFAEVETVGEGIQSELEIGDIVIFSTLLIHASGDILNDTIRWSCHYRYTNMLDNNFIERGFPNPYIYKPITKQ